MRPAGVLQEGTGWLRSRTQDREGNVAYGVSPHATHCNLSCRMIAGHHGGSDVAQAPKDLIPHRHAALSEQSASAEKPNPRPTKNSQINVSGPE